jgi:hypothetical protein
MRHLERFLGEPRGSMDPEQWEKQRAYTEFRGWHIKLLQAWDQADRRSPSDTEEDREM